MHGQGYIHRDLKPANILVGDHQSRIGPSFLDQKRQLYIADFGLCRQRPATLQPMTKQIATLWYRAPEVMLGNTKYTEKVDIWSAGVIIHEMLTGKVKF